MLSDTQSPTSPIQNPFLHHEIVCLRFSFQQLFALSLIPLHCSLPAAAAAAATVANHSVLPSCVSFSHPSFCQADI